MRLIRHDSQARATWARFVRLASGGAEVVPIGESSASILSLGFETLLAVDAKVVTAGPFVCREELAAKVVYIESIAPRKR